MHDGHHVMLIQNNGTNLVLINLENFAVPSIGLGFFVSRALCNPAGYTSMIHEDTNLLPKTILQKSTMKSSGILKEKSIQKS